MYYMRIQRVQGADVEFRNECMGYCIKRLLNYCFTNNDYKGHFILKLKD